MSCASQELVPQLPQHIGGEQHNVLGGDDGDDEEEEVPVSDQDLQVALASFLK